ncbi:hypothetical protein LWE61_09790 [Sphingobium sufflavum]|uniref:hypothetical protein n=1 Tax=Sphingobium sufflavum TaxID=1129547 RepID=UPI001F3D5FC4|nr:hypothetical protein [Sphingobium sufflavum]MCE7796848.1 hypothetical protein [Sphingobium sufflavum]
MRIRYPLGAFAALLALSACGKKPEETPVENDIVVNEVENVTDAPPPSVVLPEEDNSAKPVENKVAPPEISEQQQMQDDAEATGMTSRLPDEDAQPPLASGTPR